MTGLDLKLGGIYRTRDGHIVRIVEYFSYNDHFKFKADNGSFYTPSGRLFVNRKSKKDLISEHHDDPIVDNVLTVDLTGYPSVRKIIINLPNDHPDTLIQINKGTIHDSYVYRKEIGAVNDD